VSEKSPDDDDVHSLKLTQLPTIFTDGIANIARGPGIVRMYLIRYDPAMVENVTAAPVVIGQLVMPTNGFAAMALFFKEQLDDMIAKREVTPEAIEQLRKMVPGLANAT